MGAGFSGYLDADDRSGIIAGAPLKPGLGDIPESCVSLILSRLDPLEICKLASLNRAFRLASSADFVWESKLPENYQILAKKLLAEYRPDILSKKEIYARLCHPCRFAAGTKEAWLEKSRGGVCVSIHWRGLKITGIDDRRYWNHIPTEESRFQTVAYLQQIWWVEAEGELEFDFPAGNYSLFFRLQLGKTTTRRHGRRVCNVDQVHGWNRKPVRFKLWASNGHQSESQCFLKEGGGGGRWINYHAGDFSVETSTSPMKIKFSMTQIDCTHTKGGLSLDCVLIYPSRETLSTLCT